MPLVVDKNAIRLEIMKAFAHLSDERPLTAISLREIAAEAGMSHTKVLRYFESKTKLHVATVHWASSFIYESIASWFDSHSLADYPGKTEYLDAFFAHFQTEKQDGVNPRDVVMTCALGSYSPEIKAAVKEEFDRIGELFGKCLGRELGRALTENEISAVSVSFFGIYFARFNESLPDGAVCRPLSGFESLSQSPALY